MVMLPSSAAGKWKSSASKASKAEQNNDSIAKEILQSVEERRKNDPER
jgi:hypothetical protein